VPPFSLSLSLSPFASPSYETPPAFFSLLRSYPCLGKRGGGQFCRDVVRVFIYTVCKLWKTQAPVFTFLHNTVASSITSRDVYTCYYRYIHFTARTPPHTDRPWLQVYRYAASWRFLRTICCFRRSVSLSRRCFSFARDESLVRRSCSEKGFVLVGDVFEFEDAFFFRST
jgi:hypothetical protein